MKPIKDIEEIETFDDDDEPLETPKDLEFTAAERRARMLDKILGELRPGFQISIHRVQPGWCRGHLETLDIGDEDEPIDLQYLSDTWGGDVLRLRVKDEKRVWVKGCDIPLLSFPPKRWGKVLPNPHEPQAQQAAPQQSETLGNIEQLINIMDKLRGPQTQAQPADSTSAMVDMFKLLLKQQAAATQQQLQPAIAQPLSGMQQLIDTVKVVNQLKGLLGTDEPASDRQPAEAGMFDQINTLLNTYLKIKDKTDTTPKLTGPNPPQANPQHNPRQLAGQIPGGSPLPATGLLEALKTMPAKQIADSFITAVGQLPEEKRTEIFQTMFDLLGLNNQEEEDDETEPEEDENIDNQQ